jgi:putative ABC transport system permease protein
MTEARDPVVVRLYRRALRVLPQDFREANGAGMEAMLRDEWLDRSGPVRAALLVRALLDLVWTALITRMGGGMDDSERRWKMGWADLGMDVKVSMRSLTKAPLFTLTAVLSLGLGVGGVATVYGVADRLLLRPIQGVRDPGRLVEVGQMSLPYPVIQDLAAGMGSMDGVAGHRARTVALDPGSGVDARPVEAGIVTGNYFDLLGVAPERGRLLTPGDNLPGAPAVAVLSHALWTEMGAPPDVLDRDLRVNGATFRVVGVAPAGFGGLRLWSHPAFWMTVESWPLVSLGRTPDVHSRNWGWIAAVGRLRPGVTVATATAEARSLARRIDAEYPKNAGDLDHVALTPARARAAGPIEGVLEPLLLALAAVVALALLAAAANVANLLLARATRRAREFAVRSALGASRVRLGRLVAVETGLLVFYGAVAGTALSVAALRGLEAVRLPERISFESASLSPDGRLLTVGAAVLLVVLAVAGLTPAILAGRMGSLGLASDRSGGSGRRGLGLRATFAAIQVAVSVVLLAGTALFGRSMVRALAVDLGFDPSQLAVVQVDRALFHDDQATAGRAFTQLVEAIREAPGVEAVSWSTVPPLSQGEDRESFEITGRPWSGPPPSVEVDAVGPDFFRASGIPLVAGDAAALRRLDGGLVGVVSEAMARQYWPGENPVGAHVQVMGMDVPVAAVARDSRLHGYSSEPRPLLYGVFPTPPPGGVSLVLRGVDAKATLGSIRNLTRSVDRRLVVVEATTGPDLVGLLLAPQRVGGIVFLLFGVLAVALSLIGVYGVVAFGVGARLREFGVRLTLGAAPDRVVRDVLVRNLLPVLAGIVAGAGTSVALTRAAAAFLFGVSAADLLPAAAAAGVVLAMALLATWIPARRAGQVDPAEVLAVE